MEKNSNNLRIYTRLSGDVTNKLQVYENSRKCIRDVFQMANGFGDNCVYRLKRDTLYIYWKGWPRTPHSRKQFTKTKQYSSFTRGTADIQPRSRALSPRWNTAAWQTKHANNVHSACVGHALAARAAVHSFAASRTANVYALVYTRATIHALQVPPRHSSVNERRHRVPVRFAV